MGEGCLESDCTMLLRQPSPLLTRCVLETYNEMSYSSKHLL